MIGKFVALNVALEWVVSLRGVVDAIGRRDRDLADKIRRAASSVPLNLAEGSRRAGKDRAHFFRIAAGSAAEARAALDVAVAWKYIAVEQLAQSSALLDRVLALCWRLTHVKAA